MISAAETLLTLKQVRGRIPGRNGKQISTETLRQWMRIGRRGVRLETIKIGGTIYTSEQALDRFIVALNPGQRQQPKNVGRPVKIESVRERALRMLGAK